MTTYPEKISTHAVSFGARLVSLDTFRGATIVAMLLTATPGAGYTSYAMLRHADWNGWTFTDCVAPCFMWIVGLALALSFHKRLNRGDSRITIFHHALRRATLLFAVGVILGILPALVERDASMLLSFTLMGTLQRIAIAYLIGCAMLLLIPSAKAQLTVAGIIIGIYATCLLLLSAPGFTPGDLSPQGNIVSFLDTQWLGVHSARSHPLLSAFSAAATVALGAAAGLWFIDIGDPARRLRLLFLLGTLLLLASWLSSLWIPPNNKLWTPTYVLLMGGIACLAFAAIYWLVDVKGKRAGTLPFVMFGANPLTIWAASAMVGTLLGSIGFVQKDGGWRSLWTLCYEMFFQPFGTQEASVLAFAVAWVLPMFTMAYVMYRNHWIVRL